MSFGVESAHLRVHVIQELTSCRKIILQLPPPPSSKSHPGDRYIPSVQEEYRHTQKRSMSSNEGTGFLHVSRTDVSGRPHSFSHTYSHRMLLNHGVGPNPGRNTGLDGPVRGRWELDLTLFVQSFTYSCLITFYV